MYRIQLFPHKDILTTNGTQQVLMGGCPFEPIEREIAGIGSSVKVGRRMQDKIGSRRKKNMEKNMDRDGEAVSNTQMSRTPPLASLNAPSSAIAPAAETSTTSPSRSITAQAVTAASSSHSSTSLPSARFLGINLRRSQSQAPTDLRIRHTTLLFDVDLELYRRRTMSDPEIESGSDDQPSDSGGGVSSSAKHSLIDSSPSAASSSPAVSLDDSLPSNGSDLSESLKSLNIVFKSKVVSRDHAEFCVSETGQVMIRDVGSSSGTFLNRVRLSASGKESKMYPIKSGDVVQLGIDYQGRQVNQQTGKRAPHLST